MRRRGSLKKIIVLEKNEGQREKRKSECERDWLRAGSRRPELTGAEQGEDRAERRSRVTGSPGVGAERAACSTRNVPGASELTCCAQPCETPAVTVPLPRTNKPSLREASVRAVHKAVTRRGPSGGRPCRLCRCSECGPQTSRVRKTKLGPGPSRSRRGSRATSSRPDVALSSRVDAGPWRSLSLTGLQAVAASSA